jgi:hypothetical protein
MMLVIVAYAVSTESEEERGAFAPRGQGLRGFRPGRAELRFRSLVDAAQWRRLRARLVSES